MGESFSQRSVIDESPSRRRILSARQQNEPILVVNQIENTITRSINNISSQLHSPSQRDTSQVKGRDSSPKQQHFQSNRGVGTFRTSSSPRPKNVSLHGSSPLKSGEKYQTIGTGEGFTSALQDISPMAPAVVNANQLYNVSEFKYQKKQPTKYYKHNLDVFESSPITNGVSPNTQTNMDNTPGTLYRYATKVDSD